MNAIQMDADRLHSVESASRLLGGVSTSTIRAWFTQGKLRRVKIGRLTRVRESELLALIKPETGSHTKIVLPARI